MSLAPPVCKWVPFVPFNCEEHCGPFSVSTEGHSLSSCLEGDAESSGNLPSVLASSRTSHTEVKREEHVKGREGSSQVSRGPPPFSAPFRIFSGAVTPKEAEDKEQSNPVSFIRKRFCLLPSGLLASHATERTAITRLKDQSWRWKTTL